MKLLVVFGLMSGSALFLINCGGGNGGGTASGGPLFSDETKIFESECRTSKNGRSSWVYQKTFGKDWFSETAFYYDDPQCNPSKIDEIIKSGYNGVTQSAEAELAGWQTYEYRQGPTSSTAYSVYNVRYFNWRNRYQYTGWKLGEPRNINGLKEYSSDNDYEWSEGASLKSTMKLENGRVHFVRYVDHKPQPDDKRIYNRVSNENARKVPAAGQHQKPVPLDLNLFSGVFESDCFFDEGANTSYFGRWTFKDDSLLRQQHQFTGPGCKSETAELVFEFRGNKLEGEVYSEVAGWLTFVYSTGLSTVTPLTAAIAEDFTKNRYYGYYKWQVGTPYEINGRKWQDSSKQAMAELIKPLNWSVKFEGEQLKIMFYDDGLEVPEKAIVYHRKSK